MALFEPRPLIGPTAALLLAALPALAGEGNGEPFPFTGTVTRTANLPAPDTGSEQIPDNTSATAAPLTWDSDLLPSTSNEGIVQTPSSLPRDASGRAIRTAQSPSARPTLSAAAGRRGIAAPSKDTH